MDDGYFFRHLSFLKKLLRVNKAEYSDILKEAPKQVIKFIIECSYNILKGTIRLQLEELESAIKLKHLYKSVASKKNNFEEKRNILIKNRIFVKKVIRLVLKALEK